MGVSQVSWKAPEILRKFFLDWGFFKFSDWCKGSYSLASNTSVENIEIKNLEDKFKTLKNKLKKNNK